MADQEFELTAKLRIRAAEADDAKDLHAYCFANNTTLEEVTEQLNEDLKGAKNGNLHRIVAEASGHAIGHIRIERHKLDESLGEVSQLTVSAPFRTFGVSNQLIEAAEQISQDNGIKTLQIEFTKSEASPALIDAYKKWGFNERPIVVLEKFVGASAQTDEASPPQPEDSPKEASGEGEQQELI